LAEELLKKHFFFILFYRSFVVTLLDKSSEFTHARQKKE